MIKRSQELPSSRHRLTPFTCVSLVCALALAVAFQIGAVVPRIPSEPFSTPGYVFMDSAPPREETSGIVFYWSQNQVGRIRFFNPRSNKVAVRFSLDIHATPCDGQSAVGAWFTVGGRKRWIAFSEANTTRVAWPRPIQPGATQILTIEGSSSGCPLPDGRIVFWWVGNITVL